MGRRERPTVSVRVENIHPCGPAAWAVELPGRCVGARPFSVEMPNDCSLSRKTGNLFAKQNIILLLRAYIIRKQIMSKCYFTYYYYYFYFIRVEAGANA
jgi:hypothetical protein